MKNKSKAKLVGKSEVKNSNASPSPGKAANQNQSLNSNLDSNTKVKSSITVIEPKSKITKSRGKSGKVVVDDSDEEIEKISYIQNSSLKVQRLFIIKLERILFLLLK